jgi:hypothetical protein
MSKYYTLIFVTPCLHEGIIPLNYRSLFSSSSNKKANKNIGRIELGHEVRDYRL